jgi:hypothetical protein
VHSRTAIACGAMLLAFAVHAEQGEFTLGAGLHYSSGDYGLGTTTRITMLAATGSYQNGPWVYKATVPYLEVSGASTVLPGTGPVRGGAATTRTESGLGDIVLSATYEAYYDRATTLGIDLTAKLKLATADERRGLGTGEHDVAFAADGHRTFDRVTAFGGIAYYVLGDAPGAPLDNVWGANLGASYRLDARDSAGAMLEGRERVAPGTSRQRELVGFFVRKLDRSWKAQAYALIGLADGSPDWGLGLSLARPL